MKSRDLHSKWCRSFLNAGKGESNYMDLRFSISCLMRERYVTLETQEDEVLPDIFVEEDLSNEPCGQSHCICSDGVGEWRRVRKWGAEMDLHIGDASCRDQMLSWRKI